MAPPTKRLPKGVRVASAEELLMAKTQGQIEKTVQNLADLDIGSTSDDRGTVTHTRPQRVRVWKPTPDGYFPKSIPVTNLGQALSSGFLANCPDCGGYCDDDQNSCPGRPPRQFRNCPVPNCNEGKRKKLYDNMPEGVVLPPKTDPMEITDEHYGLSTPADRTRARLNAHMWTYHPVEASALGVEKPYQRERTWATP